MYKHKNGILLRKAGRGDLPDLLALKQESWFGTHGIAILNEDDQARWFEAQTRDDSQLTLVAEHDGLSVGIYKIAHIDWVNRSYDSAHDVFASARGKGYGKTVLEAGVDFGFEVLNMHRLDTEVLENNRASQKTAIFAGFLPEGLRRKAVHKCGQWLDSITYGLLREHWEQLPRVLAYDGVCNTSYVPKDGRP